MNIKVAAFTVSEKSSNIDVDVGSCRFHDLKQKDSSLAYPSSKSFNIRVKGVLYFT